ncbi:MAG TPA: hypothetical protein VFZ61_00840, partial [Polyangiales bacterium]
MSSRDDTPRPSRIPGSQLPGQLSGQSLEGPRALERPELPQDGRNASRLEPGEDPRAKADADAARIRLELPADAARPVIALRKGSGRVGPFGALIVAAATDPAAARGLAGAYSLLAVAARRRIIEAVLSDATAEGISASPALIALLAVEDDPELARLIADGLNSAGGDGLRSTVSPRALLAGDQERGGVLLIRPLHGTFVEVLALAWTSAEGVTHALFDPLVDDTVASTHTARLPDGLRFEETPTQLAVDVLAAVLWSHRRRHGSLPPGVDRFSDLFGIPPNPLLESL